MQVNSVASALILPPSVLPHGDKMPLMSARRCRAGGWEGHAQHATTRLTWSRAKLPGWAAQRLGRSVCVAPDRKARHILLKPRSKRGYAPPLPNAQTGMPRFLALSARLSWMPVPGNTMMPIGKASSIASLRLNGAALAWRVQSGL